MAPGPEPVARGFVSQRLRLNYLDWGHADAPPLVLVHGGRDHARNWDWVAQALRHRFHIVAPDLRGHGDSAWEADGHYDPFGFVADLAALVRHIGHGAGRPVAMIGHSLGGNIVLRHAALYPDTVTRLVAIEGLGPTPSQAAARDAADPATRARDWIEQGRAVEARAPRRYPTIAAAEARLREKHPQLDADRVAHLTRHGVRAHPAGGLVWKFDPLLRFDRPADPTAAQIDRLWAQIACPVLLAYGRDSWASNPAEDGRAAKLRDARVVLFDRAGHWVHHDRCATFVAEVTGFLDE